MKNHLLIICVYLALEMMKVKTGVLHVCTYMMIMPFAAVEKKRNK